MPLLITNTVGPVPFYKNTWRRVDPQWTGCGPESVPVSALILSCLNYHNLYEKLYHASLRALTVYLSSGFSTAN